MPAAFQYKPRFVDIRVRPPSEEEDARAQDVNALKPGERTLTGNPLKTSIRTPEILDKLEQHPIWRQRAEEKAGAKQGFVVGTGVACVVMAQVRGKYMSQY